MTSRFMGGFSESDLPGLELCPHGERRKYCESCNGIAQSAFARQDADLPEWMIEAECTKLLEQDGWRALRTDPVSDKGRAKGFGELGMADHLYIRYLDTFRIEFPSSDGKRRIAVLKAPAAEVAWIEYKSTKGKPKKHQIEWHTKERARGALTPQSGTSP